jgi:cytoskeleton protein RodZ
MLSAGALLRQERLKQNRTIVELSHQTCIAAKYLEAIESEDISALPGEFFYKSFLKQYAAALQLEEEQTKLVLGSAARIEEADPLPALNAAYQIAETQRRQSTAMRPRPLVAFALLVMVLAGGSAVYSWWAARRASEEAAALADASNNAKQFPEPQTVQAAAQAAAQAKPAPIVSSPQVPVATPAPDATATQMRSRTEPPASAVAPVGGAADAQTAASVNLLATEQTWVSVSSEGKTVFSGILEPSQTKTIDVGQHARLLTGNAAGLDVRWNGKSIGPIGARGQVRVVLLTPEAYEIQSPASRL